MPRKEKYEFEGVALRRKVISKITNKDKCNNCFLSRKNCYAEKPNGDFIYDCYSRPSTNTSYIFVKK